MSERDGYPQGVPAWMDISTSDLEGSRAFYGALFGWDWEIEADPDFGGYSTATVRGKRVCGAAPRPDESTPVTWNTFFAVDDADKVVAAVTAAGGTIVMPPLQLGELGRMAYAVDPTGAPFGLLQQQAHRGAQLVNEPGTVVWNELVTPDLDRAAEFYATTIGIGFEDMDTGGNGVYKLLTVDGRTAGGAMPATGEMAQLPPHWGVYFEVADAEATVAKAEELGAEVLMGVQPTPQGPMATLRDPQGGVFAIIASGSTE